MVLVSRKSNAPFSIASVAYAPRRCRTVDGVERDARGAVTRSLCVLGAAIVVAVALLLLLVVVVAAAAAAVVVVLVLVEGALLLRLLLLLLLQFSRQQLHLNDT